MSHAIFLASRALFGLSRASTVLYVLSTLGSGAVGFALRSVGAPRYDARGVLASEGEDLSAPGVTSLMWDAVWLTWAVHGLVALVSRWFWALYLTIPACASDDRCDARRLMPRRRWRVLGVDDDHLAEDRRGGRGARGGSAAGAE